MEEEKKNKEVEEGRRYLKRERKKEEKGEINLLRYFKFWNLRKDRRLFKHLKY